MKIMGPTLSQTSVNSWFYQELAILVHIILGHATESLCLSFFIFIMRIMVLILTGFRY